MIKVHSMGGGQILGRRNLEWPIFRNFEIAVEGQNFEQ